MDACPIIVLVFNLWLRHVSPLSNGGRWPQLEAEDALGRGLCGPRGWVCGCHTGLCAGSALSLSHGRLCKLTPTLKSPGVETMTGMVIVTGFIMAPTVQLMIVYLTSKPFILTPLYA